MPEAIPQSLQLYLVKKFREWQPLAPSVVERTKRSVTLKLEEQPFTFMKDHLLYRIQRKEKIPPWETVYSGCKTTVEIDNLAPSHPHKFRLQIIIKSTAVSSLAEEAIKYYGDENAVYNIMDGNDKTDEKLAEDEINVAKQSSKELSVTTVEKLRENTIIGKEITSDQKSSQEVIKSEEVNDPLYEEINEITCSARKDITQRSVDYTARSQTFNMSQKWLESRWSEETWTSTDTDGTSAMCFCMAVRCGYYKQIQIMLDERPMLIGAINSNNGLTPLATAVRKGDINIVKYILSLEAEVDQQTTAGQTPLHLAVLAGHTAIADLLLEKGADFKAEDFNGLRVEHYAVDSCKLDVVNYIMDKGGDVKVVDSNGWTPLFRAVCQGTKTEVIEELLHRGSNVDVTDRRGLTLVAAARLLRNRQGRSRDSILRLVDSQFPHEKALANFTRLTKKIYSVHTLFK